jgi:Flp pilus assembly protein CpaB
MVMTRTAEETSTAPSPPRLEPAPRRRIERPHRLPGGRAVVGGLLVALAGVGTLVAWQQASGTPDARYAVATRALRPGEALAAGDVRLVPVDLPRGVAGGAFRDADAVAGRVALGPIDEGELVQAGALSEPGSGVPTAEVSFALARDRALDGRLASGDLVDVFVTVDAGTSLVAERVQVVTVTDGGASFATGAELTVTLALTDPAVRDDLIQAVRAGEVTLVRATHAGEASSGAGPPATATSTSTIAPQATGPPATAPSATDAATGRASATTTTSAVAGAARPEAG